MNDLSDRQRAILSLVIQDYIKATKPVGSKNLVKSYHLSIKHSTVRNELHALTELGYLRQPHTSAGRVPTEDGYRYFVRQLMEHSELPSTTKRTIAHQFYQVGPDVDRWMRLAASVLANQAQAASLVTAPHSDQLIFKHLELINTHGRQVLMVLVLSGGEVRQQMLALAEPVSQERLSQVAQRLTEQCQDLSLDRIAYMSPLADALEQDILKLVLEEMHRMSQARTGEVYHDGFSHVLEEPEFGESENAREALRILEERPLLEDLLTRSLPDSEIGGVQVLIGGEDTWEELRDCSMVLARYGAPGITGTLGVLGPIRMPYGRNIPTVRFIADLLSHLVIDMQTEQ